MNSSDLKHACKELSDKIKEKRKGNKAKNAIKKTRFDERCINKDMHASSSDLQSVFHC